MRDTLGSSELAKLPLFVPVGEGELNFKPIMKEISKLDIEWVAVEQDRVFWGSPKDNMQASRENLKKRFGI
jgi:sugar phosphate isomerase/epimerase